MEKAKILFLFGSHRRGGNCDKVTELIKRHPRYDEMEPEYIFLNEKKIENCQSCYYCRNGKINCKINDDVAGIVESMKNADIIVYVPVIYAFGTNSIFQAFLERAGFGYFSPQNRPLKDKLASLIIIGRRYAHCLVAAQIIFNIMLNQMIIPGSGRLPLLYGHDFPGNIEADREGIGYVNETLNRLLDWNRKYRVTSK